MVISNFINEIGNKIKIKVQKHIDVGTNNNSKEKVKFTGVKITMQGPTSEMTNEITLREAIELHKCLGEYLNTIKNK